MASPVGPGDILAGKYQVERVLGEGGMGVVVAARHLQLDQMVALKFLLPEAIANPDARNRFLREARIAARLQSEHVARIIDVGTLEHGAPYIVMEFLHGTDLAGVLAQQGVLPVQVAVDFVLQACDAIAEAHALGIVHRDLKPQNLFLTWRRDKTSLVKVLDFGISKSMAGDELGATRTQAVMGSPTYMSPEQMRSAKLVDARTDLWALGIILYQLVVGHVPWSAETYAELCLKVMMDPLPPFPAPQPAGFEAVVRRCLEKVPDQRFPDVHALALALFPFAPPQAQPLVERIGRVLRGQAGDRVATPAIAGSGPGTFREAAGERMMRTATGSRRARIAGLVAALGVLGGIVTTAVVLGGGGPATDSPRPTQSAPPSVLAPRVAEPPRATPPAVAEAPRDAAVPEAPAAPPPAASPPSAGPPPASAGPPPAPVTAPRPASRTPARGSSPATVKAAPSHPSPSDPLSSPD